MPKLPAHPLRPDAPATTSLRPRIAISRNWKLVKAKHRRPQCSWRYHGKLTEVEAFPSNPGGMLGKSSTDEEEGGMFGKSSLKVSLSVIALFTPMQALADGGANPHVHAHHYTNHVETHPSQGDVRVIDNAKATLVMTKSGAFANIETSELVPGNAYTLWFVVINEPSACENSPCNANDVLKRTSMTKADVGYGDGLIAGNDGKGHFTTFRSLGELPQAWLGTGFTDPWASEIHLVVHDHGPVIAGREAEMTGTYRGGCTEESLPGIVPATAKADGSVGPNGCKLVQDVIFVQPGHMVAAQ